MLNNIMGAITQIHRNAKHNIRNIDNSSNWLPFSRSSEIYSAYIESYGSYIRKHTDQYIRNCDSHDQVCFSKKDK